MDIDQQIKDYPTCEQRVEAQKNSREKWFAELFEAIENQEPYDGYEDPTDALYETPLGIDKYSVMKITLSAGGPADWLEVIYEMEGNISFIISVTYHFQDWFDHAERKVYRDEALYQYAEQMLEVAAYN